MSLFVTSIVASFALSLIGKFMADAWLDGHVNIIGSFIGLHYSLNRGVAFSVNFGSPWQEILIGVALLLLAWAATHARSPLGRVAFGMILGGALGNIADRLFDGAVTDFFQVGTFPIFNVADSFITVGVIVAFIDAVLETKRRKKSNS
jgi:signal peptidase II